MTVVSLLVLVALLLGNAFFVAAEFALVSTRADQIEPRAEAGSPRAVKTLAAMRNVSEMMAGAQLGITLCSLGLGAVGEPAIAHLIEVPLEAAHVPEGLLHPIALAIALALVTVLHMVLGEMVPKNITLAGPDRAALAARSAAGRAGAAAAALHLVLQHPGQRLRPAVRRAAHRRGGGQLRPGADRLDGHPVAARGPAGQRGRRAGRGRPDLRAARDRRRPAADRGRRHRARAAPRPGSWRRWWPSTASAATPCAASRGLLGLRAHQGRPGRRGPRPADRRRAHHPVRRAQRRRRPARGAGHHAAGGHAPGPGGRRRPHDRAGGAGGRAGAADRRRPGRRGRRARGAGGR